MSSTATTPPPSLPHASFPRSAWERKTSPLRGALAKFHSTLIIALIGSVLLWAALPPLALGWLGWIALIPWLILIQSDALPGRRPYRALYFAGLAFWLMAIHWLRLPHPATHLGWIALSAYLAVYLPVFVGLSRVAVHQLRLPLWIAAPVVWTGLELARAHLLTGFLMGSLAHTQVHWIGLIQVSDLVGEYGVDFVIVLVAACIVNLFWPSTTGLQWRLRALVPAVVALAAALLYGHWRLGDFQSSASETSTVRRGPRVALIQGNSLAEWKADPNRERQIMDEYVKLSLDAVAKARSTGDGRPLGLIVWPETMFRSPLITIEPGYTAPSEVTQAATYGIHDLAALVSRLGVPVLLGVDRIHASPPVADDVRPQVTRYNSAALVGRDGKVVGTFDKIHRVMFGEYIPFAEWLPFLYKWTPLTGGIAAGVEPVALWVDATYCFAPNICYETAIPHVIRRQVATLERRNEFPDALVNLTNDAWYWGSSELDMHLACDVFRAVETRVPVLIAANGGISAWIDRWGRVLAESPRQQTDVIIADLTPGTMRSWYVQFGDWFAAVCLTCCVGLSIVGWKSRRDLKLRMD